jgi:DNA-binding NarL/FixJ family response regulator
MSMVHARAGAAVRATWLLSAIDKVRESTGEPLRPQLQQEQDDAMARLRTQLGDAAFERVWAAGALATLDETFDQALSPVWLGPDPLTEAKPATSAPIISAREQDVLRLVVAGQSDRVIADTLFISRRTASKHVASILSKLEVSTRAEAAVRAVREGLV